MAPKVGGKRNKILHQGGEKRNVMIGRCGSGGEPLVSFQQKFKGQYDFLFHRVPYKINCVYSITTVSTDSHYKPGNVAILPLCKSGRRDKRTRKRRRKQGVESRTGRLKRPQEQWTHNLHAGCGRQSILFPYTFY